MTNSQESSHKGSILVIGDQPASLRILMTILTEHGYAVHPANEGDLGLRFVNHTLPDLVLADIGMRAWTATRPARA